MINQNYLKPTGLPPLNIKGSRYNSDCIGITRTDEELDRVGYSNGNYGNSINKIGCSNGEGSYLKGKNGYSINKVDYLNGKVDYTNGRRGYCINKIGYSNGK